MQTTDVLNTVLGIAALAWVAVMVEAVQAARFLRGSSEEQERWAEEVGAEFEGADDAAVLSHPWAMPSRPGYVAQAGLCLVWGIGSLALITAIGSALAWIVDQLDTASRGPTVLVYWVALGSLYLTTVVPIGVHLVRMVRSEKRALAAMKAVEDRRKEARDRLGQQGPGDDAGGSPSP